ncbi:MAG: hypothetical protein JSV91_02830 [Phycisphaerales bacterium]|nr:MAG: hypothetical protein JSV91_02830 [Phycisphaerales bacterium]
MWQRVVLILVCVLILAAVGVVLQKVLSGQHGIKTMDEVAGDMNALKAEAEAMEREAIADRLEGELAAARGDEYTRFLESMLISADGQPPSAAEMIYLTKVHLAEHPDLDPEVIARFGELIAKLQAELEANPGPVCLRGAITRPGAYMLPIDGVMTLSQLLEAAGGAEVNEGEELSIRVFRTPHDPDKPVFFVVVSGVDDLAINDFALAPNDVIIVER